ncbi:inorganic phosphate transporter 1-11-like [Cucumis melo var. makuwa]|uniref:Inorganic phosphate transporter 1-11-like n=1 Tax=Cucumis melo var. makuwa TaxID=1194695 RepID=A0A5D3E6J7_CUCMM|nr:inorganic phosphate transporter 1-11-like [Cucumis melo var. makuwa]
MAIAVLDALDNARTQWYHITAIVIAGMGFFTDAYDLFCISTVSKLLGRLYYFNPDSTKPGKLPNQINNAVVGVALVGTLMGQLFFGWLGDKLGRKKVYGVTLVLMAFCAICSGLSFGSTSKSVIGLVSMILSKIFLSLHKAPAYKADHVFSTQPEGDFLWRIVLMLGALPAILTYYWRMKMPETGRYTALIEGNAKQAAADMGKVLEIQIQAEQEKLSNFKAANEYGLLSKEFFDRHGLHLIGTTTTWFLLDIAFYSNNLTQKDIFPAMNLTRKPEEISALEEVYETSKAMFLVALLGTFPGYWFTVFLIEKLGRFKIQLIGFFMMSIFMAVLGVRYNYMKNHPVEFAILYGLTFFFANFGPNSTTFVLPAELFPTRVRSTCHALSAASGKAGAIVGAFGVQNYTLDGNPSKIQKAMIFLAFTNMLGFVFTFLVTETKGRSLEEISGEDGGREGENETHMPVRSMGKGHEMEGQNV